ncbi:hypothetical protein GAMM_100151 [Gammaproteobacteria bacterium]
MRKLQEACYYCMEDMYVLQKIQNAQLAVLTDYVFINLKPYK